MELLPDTQTPSWLGLPNNAERVLLTTQGGYPTRPPPQSWLYLTPSPDRLRHGSGSPLVPLLRLRLGSGQKSAV